MSEIGNRGSVTGSRFNGAAIILGVLAVGALVAGVVSIQVYFAQWWGSSDNVWFWDDLGIDAATGMRLMTTIGALYPLCVKLSLVCVVALLFLGAIRWQRAHAR